MPALSNSVAGATWWKSNKAYQQVDETTVAGEKTTAWVSEEAEDGFWDQFLQQNPAGQFQQSSMWARAKASEKWSSVRVLIAGEHRLMGGLQLLWRPSRFGRVGYVSKGPVLKPPESRADAIFLERYTLSLLKKVTHRKRLRAVIVQPPDICERMSGSLRSAGFLPALRIGVSDATWIVDVSDGFEAARRRMDRHLRKSPERAMRGNLRIREGERSDLATFFELMLSSCRRQHATPRPSDLKHLLALWDAARPKDAIRLFLVDHDEHPVAGQLEIHFGKTVTIWKKGWNGEARQLSPNHICMYEGIRCASEAGYSRCDYAAFDRKMAEAMIAGRKLTPKQANSRCGNFFHTGGKPMLLPRAHVYLPNWILRTGYRVRHPGYRHMDAAVAPRTT